MIINKTNLFKRAKESFELNNNIDIALDCMAEDMKKYFVSNEKINKAADSLANIIRELAEKRKFAKHIDIDFFISKLEENTNLLRAGINDDRQEKERIEFRK